MFAFTFANISTCLLEFFDQWRRRIISISYARARRAHFSTTWKIVRWMDVIVSNSKLTFTTTMTDSEEQKNNVEIKSDKKDDRRSGICLIKPE